MNLPTKQKQNHIQYSTINHNGKKHKIKECMCVYVCVCVCITEALCCTQDCKSNLLQLKNKIKKIKSQ